MKKKIFISCAVSIIVTVLFVPFGYDTLNDGETKIYFAPLLKIYCAENIQKMICKLYPNGL